MNIAPPPIIDLPAPLSPRSLYTACEQILTTYLHIFPYLDPCEICNETVSSCSEQTSFNCVCFRGLEMENGVCKGTIVGWNCSR